MVNGKQSSQHPARVILFSKTQEHLFEMEQSKNWETTRNTLKSSYVQNNAILKLSALLVRHFWKCLSRIHHLNITLVPTQKQMCFPHSFHRSCTAERPVKNGPLKSKQPLHHALQNFHRPLRGVIKSATSFFMIVQSHPLNLTSA